MNANLSGKVALVAGSSAGIGKTIALKLALNGADVVIHGRRPEPALPVVAEIERMGRRSIFQKADLNHYEQVRSMVNDILIEWGKIDIVVASGMAFSDHSVPQLFHEIDPEHYVDYITKGMFCRLYCLKAVLPHMIEKQAGKIVFISTDAGRIPTPGESMIGAAAAGLIFLTKALAKELSRWRIHVNTICTTVASGTPAFETAMSGQMAKVFEKAIKSMPFWPLTAADIAETALFLASSDSDRITGQTISVNGGLSFPG